MNETARREVEGAYTASQRLITKAIKEKDGDLRKCAGWMAYGINLTIDALGYKMQCVDADKEIWKMVEKGTEK